MCPSEDKLAALNSTSSNGANGNRIGDMTGLISKAKEGLAKSKSKGDVTRSPSYDPELKKQLSPEPKKSENELHWEELVRNMNRPLNLCDLDFTDLTADDEKDVLAPRGLGGSIPPPPPPCGMPAPPMMMMKPNSIPAPMFPPAAPAGMFNSFGKNPMDSPTNTIQKNKKTVKLFWKEVREDLIPVTVGQTIWDELPPTKVDTDKLEHLFESRAKDIMTKVSVCIYLVDLICTGRHSRHSYTHTANHPHILHTLPSLVHKPKILITNPADPLENNALRSPHMRQLCNPNWKPFFWLPWMQDIQTNINNIMLHPHLIHPHHTQPIHRIFIFFQSLPIFN